MDGGTSEDVLGQIMPGAGAGIDEMIGAAQPILAVSADPLQDRQNRTRDVVGSGWATMLVRHDPQLRPFGTQAKHRLHEIMPGRTHHPRRAQDDMARIGAPHRKLATQLGGAIDPERGDRILLDIGLGFGAVEHIIGRDVQDRNARLRTRGGKCGR